MQKDRQRVRLRVDGRVQGVGFRWFVVSEARRLRMGGWVRNNADGSVELEAEGGLADIQALRDRLAKGPPAARVDAVTDLPVSGEALPARFESIR